MSASVKAQLEGSQLKSAVTSANTKQNSVRQRPPTVCQRVSRTMIRFLINKALPAPHKSIDKRRERLPSVRQLRQVASADSNDSAVAKLVKRQKELANSNTNSNKRYDLEFDATELCADGHMMRGSFCVNSSAMARVRSKSRTCFTGQFLPSQCVRSRKGTTGVEIELMQCAAAFRPPTHNVAQASSCCWQWAASRRCRSRRLGNLGTPQHSHALSVRHQVYASAA